MNKKLIQEAKPPNSAELQQRPPKPILNTIEAAELTGLAKQTLECGRSGYGPAATLPFLKIGRACRYERKTVEAWLAARVTTGELSRQARMSGEGVGDE